VGLFAGAEKLGKGRVLLRCHSRKAGFYSSGFSWLSSFFPVHLDHFLLQQRKLLFITTVLTSAKTKSQKQFLKNTDCDELRGDNHQS
jgi:hypothetical protein